MKPVEVLFVLKGCKSRVIGTSRGIADSVIALTTTKLDRAELLTKAGN